MMRFTRYIPLILLVYLLLPAVGALFLLPSSENIVDVIAGDAFRASFRNSLITAGISTTVSALFGIPLAYFLARKSIKGKGIIEAIVISPIVLPPIVTGLFLLSILGPGGPIGMVADKAGIRITRSLAGIILAQIAVASPFVVIMAKTAFEEIDRKLEYASRLLGKSGLETFFKISLPLAKRGITAGLLMCFARSLGEFGATFMMAYYPRTMPVYLYVSFLSGGIERAAPVAIVLWIFGLLFIFLIRLIEKTPGW